PTSHLISNPHHPPSSMPPPQPASPLFPYTTLFRSRHIVAEAERRKPAFAILTDFPGFHLRLARKLKRRGIKNIYYICPQFWARRDRKSTRLNSSHGSISYAVFCLKKKKKKYTHNDA